MSRTYRKHKQTFESYYYNWFNWNMFYDEEEINKKRYRYQGDFSGRNKWMNWNLPKSYRKLVNSKRRAHDKQEIWREINIEKHEEQCSKWSCKDSNSWGYW